VSRMAYVGSATKSERIQPSETLILFGQRKERGPHHFVGGGEKRGYGARLIGLLEGGGRFVGGMDLQRAPGGGFFGAIASLWGKRVVVAFETVLLKKPITTERIP